MWIDSLSLHNFRGFRELDLRRQLTVLIGVNGSGKSTIVDALRASSILGPKRLPTAGCSPRPRGRRRPAPPKYQRAA
ncbi:MAG: ATP-binding protein [Nannocystaceae bacterium]|nr:ATP-binding protein [Nannocystaceae bacterium]